MTKPTLPIATRSKRSRKISSSQRSAAKRHSNRSRRPNENTDVLISAVVSSYLLTHLHHILQRAEYGALKEGKISQASNFAELRKVLCMDARSMKDAFASGLRESDHENSKDSNFDSKAA